MDKNAHHGAGPVLDRVSLREAGVDCGSGRPADEHLVSIVTQTLLRQGHDPLLGPRGRRHRRAAGRSTSGPLPRSTQSADDSSESSGSSSESCNQAVARDMSSRYSTWRDLDAAIAEQRTLSRPSMAATDGLQAAMDGFDDVVKPQRLFLDTCRGRTGGFEARLLGWMEKQEGREWLTLREKRLRAHLKPGVGPVSGIS